MKAKELRDYLNKTFKLSQRYEDWDIVIPIKRLGTSIGGSPCLDVHTISLGFDWDNGRMFIRPIEELTQAGDEYKAEKARMRDYEDRMGWISYTLRQDVLSDKEKLKNIKAQVEKHRKFRTRDELQKEKDGDVAQPAEATDLNPV